MMKWRWILAVLGGLSCADLNPAIAQNSHHRPPRVLGIDQLESPSIEPSNPSSPLGVPSVSDLVDVQPGDWAIEAARSLYERYGCLSGYPDGTYRGNRSITRYEFAAAMSACLDRVQLDRASLEEIQQLLDAFDTELDDFNTTLDNIELRVSPFSTTTKVRGEVLFALVDAFGENIDVNTTLSERMTLSFDTSFTGEDRLQTKLKAGNITRLDRVTGLNEIRLDEPRLGFDTDTDNSVELNVEYRFPLSDDIRVTLAPTGLSMGDLTDKGNPFISGDDGAVSRFGRYNPIYRIPNTDAGVGVRWKLNDAIELDVGYSAGEGSDPESGGGLWNGDYGILGQVTLNPIDRLVLGLTYIHSYSGAGRGIATGTGSNASGLSQLGSRELERPVVGNSYGIQANYEIDDLLAIGGWVGYTDARLLGLGDAEVWNWAATLAFPDLGGNGNVGGIVVGMQPRLTSVSSGLEEIGQFADRDVGLHLEAFYRIELHDAIGLTPGVIWLTAPNHDRSNEDVVVVTIRTLFEF